MTAQNIEAPGEVGTGRALRTDENNTVIVTDLDADRKAYCTLAARLALKGYSVFELSVGGYVVSRWDRTLHCSDLGQVRAFYERIGGVA